MRTHNCAELCAKNVDETVTLSGWVNKRRDLGGIIFIDLRDKRGITQIVIDPQGSPDLHEKANPIRSEWVITVTGKVVMAKRRDGPTKKWRQVKSKLKRQKSKFSHKQKTPPFSICDEMIDCGIDLRLKYRYPRHATWGDFAKISLSVTRR